MSFSKSLPWEPPSFSHARDSSARAWRTLTHPWVSQDTKHHHVSLLIPSDQLCSERHVWWQPAGDKGQQRRITHPLHPKRLHVVEMRKEVPVRETSQFVTEEPSCSNTKPSMTENSKKRYFPSDNFD